MEDRRIYGKVKGKTDRGRLEGRRMSRKVKGKVERKEEDVWEG